MLSARLTAAGRLAIPWLVGPAALLMRDRSLELTHASRCQGLLELASIAALRLNPDLSVGAVFGALHTAVFVGAIAALVALVDRSTHSLAVAGSAGFAVGLSPLFGSTLAPPWDAAAFGACAAAALVIWPAFTPRDSGRTRTRVALVAVTLLIFMLVVVSPAILNRSRPDVLAGSAPAGALMSCALPQPSLSRALTAVSTIAWWLGPFALGLAALGGFARVRWSDRRVVVALAVAALVSVVLAAASNMSAAAAVAPVLVALWWLAALGLDALVTAIGRGPARAVVAAVILLLLPALEASRRTAEIRDDRVLPRGHESQTLRQMTTRLDLVVQDAVLVQEDATVDTLLRAAVFGGRRRGKPVVTVPPDAETVARALSGHTVYAFPWRQAELSLRGFVLEPQTAERTPPAALDGLATITATRHCDTVGATWAAVAAPSGRIGVTADSDATIGPVVLYFGGATAADAVPDGWPPRTLRGFHAARYDQGNAEGTARLQADTRDAALPLDHPVLREPIVTRLTLHRTPRAPRAFAVTLGARFPFGAGKLEQGDAAVGHFTICDAPPVTISTLPPR